MINTKDILETIRMIEDENLDISTFWFIKHNKFKRLEIIQNSLCGQQVFDKGQERIVFFQQMVLKQLHIHAKKSPEPIPYTSYKN